MLTFEAFVLPKPCPLPWKKGIYPQVEEGYLSRENQETTREEEKWSPRQSQTTDVHYHFLHDYPLGPSVLVSNANMSMR